MVQLKKKIDTKLDVIQTVALSGASLKSENKQRLPVACSNGDPLKLIKALAKKNCLHRKDKTLEVHNVAPTPPMIPRRVNIGGDGRAVGGTSI